MATRVSSVSKIDEQTLVPLGIYAATAVFIAYSVAKGVSHVVENMASVKRLSDDMKEVKGDIRELRNDMNQKNREIEFSRYAPSPKDEL